MRTSCRFAMAVHVLSVLAYRKGDSVSSALLASSVNTNPVIIRRLLLALQRARLVETGRGPGSGSRLSRSPGRINLAEIYRAVEDAEPFASPRRKPSSECPVGHCIRAALDRVFASAQEALERDLTRTTLATILETVESCEEVARAGRQPCLVDGQL
jgi:Rrf2 family protein